MARGFIYHYMFLVVFNPPFWLSLLYLLLISRNIFIFLFVISFLTWKLWWHCEKEVIIRFKDLIFSILSVWVLCFYIQVPEIAHSQRVSNCFVSNCIQFTRAEWSINRFFPALPVWPLIYLEIQGGNGIASEEQAWGCWDPGQSDSGSFSANCLEFNGQRAGVTKMQPVEDLMTLGRASGGLLFGSSETQAAACR
jgi:hypothetical protein